MELIVEQVPWFDDSSETLVNTIFAITSVGGVHVASWVCYRENIYRQSSSKLSVDIRRYAGHSERMNARGCWFMLLPEKCLKRFLLFKSLLKCLTSGMFLVWSPPKTGTTFFVFLCRGALDTAKFWYISSLLRKRQNQLSSFFTPKPAVSSVFSYSFPVTILTTQPEYVHNMYKIYLRFPPRSQCQNHFQEGSPAFILWFPFHVGNRIRLFGWGGRGYKFVNPKRSEPSELHCFLDCILESWNPPFEVL